MSRPTLRDVAARAGLSVTQVSRALNNHDDVAEATRQRAREAADELRYTPNLDARRLKDPAARTDAIGIVLPSDSLRFSDPFFGDLLTAMVAEAGSAGLQLSLSTHPATTGPTEPYDLIIRRKQVDGFILLRTIDGDARITLLRGEGIPFVALGRPHGERGFPAVETDDDCFGPVFAHLVGLGHRRIACISEPQTFAMGAARLRAFHRAAADAGVDLESDLVVEAGFHEGSGHEAATGLLARSERPTAIVAMNDLLALGVLDAAAEAGVRVPRDLTVIGFDDIREARQVRPALTTVRQAASDVGAALVRLLVPTIASGQLEHVEHRIGTSLVIRESCAVAAH